MANTVSVPQSCRAGSRERDAARLRRRDRRRGAPAPGTPDRARLPPDPNRERGPGLLPAAPPRPKRAALPDPSSSRSSAMRATARTGPDRHERHPHDAGRRMAAAHENRRGTPVRECTARRDGDRRTAARIPDLRGLLPRPLPGGPALPTRHLGPNQVLSGTRTICLPDSRTSTASIGRSFFRLRPRPTSSTSPAVPTRSDLRLLFRAMVAIGGGHASLGPPSTCVSSGSPRPKRGPDGEHRCLHEGLEDFPVVPGFRKTIHLFVQTAFFQAEPVTTSTDNAPVPPPAPTRATRRV